jgi:hypothetical protein
MLALRIVEHLDVVEHILSGFDTGLVGSPPYPLPLEQIEEALGDRIIVTLPKSRDDSQMASGAI